MSRTLAERFASKISPCPITGCWWWTGGTDSSGRGSLNGASYGTTVAPRFAWRMAHGPIRDGLHVLHRCDQPACVNPAHLFLGTHTDNVRDMHAKRRAWQETHPERSPRGERHYASVLTDDQVRDIREHCRTARFGVRSPVSQTAFARKYGVSLATIQDVLNRVTWVHLP
jgi:hypothetical protein